MKLIQSLEEYKALVKDNKKRFSKIERSSFLLTSALEPLILEKKVYSEMYQNGLGIYVDEGAYYNLFLFWNASAELENYHQNKIVLLEILDKADCAGNTFAWLEQKLYNRGILVKKTNFQYELQLDSLDEGFEKAYAESCERMLKQRIMIRSCETEAEASEVVSLWKSALDSTDLPEDHLHFWIKGDSVLCAFDEAGELAGAYWWSNPGRDTVEGRHIVVSEKYYRKGIATALLLSFIKQIKNEKAAKVITWISCQNKKSNFLHENIGFKTNNKICKQYII